MNLNEDEHDEKKSNRRCGGASERNLIISVEKSVAYIASQNKSEIVDFVLEKYGARSVEDIPNTDLFDVFNELYAIEADLRSG